MDIFLIILILPFVLPLSRALKAPGLFKLLFLTVQFKSDIVIIQCLFKLTQFVQASPSSQISIYMGWIKLNHDCKILNCILNLIQFLMCTSDQIITINIPAVNIQKCMAVLYGIQILFFFHV